MKLVSALVGLAALGGVALSSAAASAQDSTTVVVPAGYVCNEWGHCWPRHHYGYGGGYYHPHYWGGYGGGYGWHATTGTRITGVAVAMAGVAATAGTIGITGISGDHGRKGLRPLSFLANRKHQEAVVIASEAKQSSLMRSNPSPSFRGDATHRTPESRDSPMCNCTSEVWSFGPSRNDGVYNAQCGLLRFARNDGSLPSRLPTTLRSGIFRAQAGVGECRYRQRTSPAPAIRTSQGDPSC